MLLEKRPEVPGAAGDDAADATTPERPSGDPGRALPLPVLLGALVLAALSLIPYKASPTYDPWAWIVWGREILQLDLSTVEGPSWKPLPVLFTAPFSLFGEAAPALWLVIARAGALLAAFYAWRVARRLGGPVAGGAAAAAVLVAPWIVRNGGLGNSEPLLVACVLAGVDRHLAGRPRAAFVAFILAGLLRPECWPFLFLYGLWLVWRERAALKLVAVGFVSLPVLWLLPEYWGSGNLFRAAERAQKPRSDSPAFADNPVLQVLENAAKLVPVAAWAGLGLALVLLAAGRVARQRRGPVLVLLGVAATWLGLVAYMTQDGFSGNLRYLIMPVVLLIVVAACGVGWAAEALVRRPLTGAAAVLATAVGVAAFALPWALGRTQDAVDAVRYQGALPHDLADAVEAAGGKDRLLACGDPYTGAFLVPAVAWRLGLHTSEVQLEPRAPAVVFRVQTNPGGRAAPSLRGVDGVPQRTLAIAPAWRIVGAGCRG